MANTRTKVKQRVSQRVVINLSDLRKRKRRRKGRPQAGSSGPPPIINVPPPMIVQQLNPTRPESDIERLASILRDRVRVTEDDTQKVVDRQAKRNAQLATETFAPLVIDVEQRPPPMTTMSILTQTDAVRPLSPPKRGTSGGTARWAEASLKAMTTDKLSSELRELSRTKGVYVSNIGGMRKAELIERILSLQ